MDFRYSWPLCAVLTLLFSCTRQIECDLWIRNVNVVDVRHGTILYQTDLLISGDSIQEILQVGETIVSKDTIDASGLYAIPGLRDMHTHNFWNIHFSGYYVANGVLGVRNMYTPMNLVGPLEDSIKSGLVIGPDYVSAGRVVEGNSPSFPDWIVVEDINDVGPAVDSLIQEGSDFVKVYNKLSPAIYQEVVRQARLKGMDVAGHIPMQVSAIDASNAGHRSIEHLLGLFELCSDDTLFQEDYGHDWFRAVMSSDDLARMTINEDKARTNFRILKENNTYVCPTLTVWNNFLYPDTDFEHDGISTTYPGEVRSFWFGSLQSFRNADSADKDMMKAKYERITQITQLLYRNGVPLLVGTDAINPCVYPGFSIHKELRLMRDCGIPDAEVLRMATLSAAEFLRVEDNEGTVEEGKLASLVLLNSNPLEKIESSSDIHSVILRGRYLDKPALDALIPAKINE